MKTSYILKSLLSGRLIRAHIHRLFMTRIRATMYALAVALLLIELVLFMLVMNNTDQALALVHPGIVNFIGMKLLLHGVEVVRAYLREIVRRSERLQGLRDTATHTASTMFGKFFL